MWWVRIASLRRYDEDAREALLIENLEILQKKTNPITRVKALKEIISLSTVGL